MTEESSWRDVPLRKVYAVVMAVALVVVVGWIVYDANRGYERCGCKPVPIPTTAASASAA